MDLSRNHSCSLSAWFERYGCLRRIIRRIIIIITEKAFREMKKDVGMTTAQNSKETRRMEWDQSLFCISSQQSLHIRTLLHYNLKLPDVYVGIVGWIYRTKIDPISILLVSLLFEQWSSLHLFSFHEMLFPLLVPGLFSWSFFLSFMVLAMYRVHSSM